MPQYGWTSAPKHLTMSGEQAAKYYKDFDPRNPRYWVFAYSNKDEAPTPAPRTKNGSIDCFIMRGAKKVVMETYAWDNSRSDGGYCEYVALRVLRSKFNNDFTTKPREDYITGIHDVLGAIRKRYYLAPITERAIKKNIFKELLNVWLG